MISFFVLNILMILGKENRKLFINNVLKNNPTKFEADHLIIGQ